jgi:hypothetical protein
MSQIQCPIRVSDVYKILWSVNCSESKLVVSWYSYVIEYGMTEDILQVSECFTCLHLLARLKVRRADGTVTGRVARSCGGNT